MTHACQHVCGSPLSTQRLAVGSSQHWASSWAENTKRAGTCSHIETSQPQGVRHCAHTTALLSSPHQAALASSFTGHRTLAAKSGGSEIKSSSSAPEAKERHAAARSSCSTLSLKPCMPVLLLWVALAANKRALARAERQLLLFSRRGGGGVRPARGALLAAAAGAA